MEEIDAFLEAVKEAYNEAKEWFDNNTWGYYVAGGVLVIAIVLLAIFNPVLIAGWNCFMMIIAPFAIIWFLLWNRKRQRDSVTVKPEQPKVVIHKEEKKKKKKKKTIE